MKDNPNVPSPDREEVLFNGALQLRAAERADYLAKACGGDVELRRRVEALLQAHEQGGSFLEEPAAAGPRKTIVLSVPLTEKPGDKIGRYKLLQQVGEGGCGVVYMAEQEEPVRRRVALKVIKLGMDTKSVIARFEAERQALAMMDHPNIAKVLDAGGTETGRPFFVMELVRGIKITDYCDQNKLSTEERLKLFVQVCHAIQHAHQKGIIHRDIKPSNILVTLHDGVPVPKVIDFGIAKATQGRLTDQTLFTAFEQFVGTPAYMSPEQAEMSGLDIDTRCDVYALGVLLYELLTGETPFDARELLASGLDKMRQTIREKEPARPSTRLSTMLNADLTNTASRRHTDAPKLVHLLRGDLDWIVMKALEKDRTRRYETANGFAVDIQRHLTNEPVLARPPSNFYRFQKLVRRNKAAFATVWFVSLMLVVGSSVCLRLYTKERIAYRRLFAAQKEQVRLREAAEAAEAKTRAENVNLEKITKAGLFLSQGKYDQAEQYIFDVPNHASIAAIFNVLGYMHAKRGQWQAAITNYSKVVESVPNDHMAYHFLMPLLVEVGDTPGYQGLRARVLDQFAGMSHPLTAAHMVEECLLLPASTSDLEAIGKLTDIAVAAGEKDNDWDEIQSVKILAVYRQANFAAAVEWAKKCLAEKRRPTRKAVAFAILAMAQQQLHQSDEARKSLAEAGRIAEKEMDRPGHLGDDWNTWVVADILMREARALIGDPQQTAGLTQAGQPADPVAALRTRAIEEAKKGQWKEATADFAKVLELESGDAIWYEYAAVLVESGDPAGYQKQRQAIWTRCAGTTNAAIARRAMKACLLLPMAGMDPAAVDKLADTAMAQENEWAESAKSLAEYRLGRFASAVEWAKKSLAQPANDRRDAQTCLVLAMAQQQLKQSTEARAAQAKALEIINTKLPKLDSGDLGNGWVDSVIADILLREAKGLIEGAGR